MYIHQRWPNVWRTHVIGQMALKSTIHNVHNKFLLYFFVTTMMKFHVFLLKILFHRLRFSCIVLACIVCMRTQYYQIRKCPLLQTELDMHKIETYADVFSYQMKTKIMLWLLLFFSRSVGDIPWYDGTSMYFLFWQKQFHSWINKEPRVSMFLPG